MLKTEEVFDISYIPSCAIVYAYEGQNDTKPHDTNWIKIKNLTLIFDQNGEFENEGYRLAMSDEVLWWAGASDCEMPEFIVCEDGVFNWIEPGFDIEESGLFKI
ncbi:hypothetical protein [Paenibacillus piscarius]|uniref:hypothetical protein n=1 Tax=Paenibacillus piscarius TaxID=1089681 RepID=UPI001EE96EAF|nr:hypothetical protein [Paenibacillus piscarius]